ncbi:hypothetical protein DFH09DRAFT_1195245 [Mycena vulgaris]|nr:hypothetical protein DFH09DRAFT_1195245 [Mycena vulgaris]
MEAPTNILTPSSTETRLTAQSSHLFQNAAGFEIVGGQFVLGDVHNHAATNVREPAGLLNTTDDGYSESEIYCSQLLRQKRGFPLYVPGPQQNLPEEYQRNGVSLGDVGRVTPDGIFDFFFNIYLPADHPINANDVPQDFTPLTPYLRRDVLHVNFEPGNYVSAPSVQKLDLDSVSDDFPGGEFMFNCEAPHGAVLALPYGAHLEKLENLENIREYAAQNAESWYRYINGARGRRLPNGSLYLVTGCEKSQLWGMASFHNVREEFQLTYKPTAGPDTAPNYRWRGLHARKNPTRSKSYNPSPMEADSLNQTTFIHGLSISLGTGIWGKLFGDVEIRQLVDSRLDSIKGGFSMVNSQGSSLFSWSLSFFGGGSTIGGKHRTTQDGDAILSDFAPVSKIFHPAELINNYLLQQAPQARVVMSHDDDWRDILQDDGTQSIVQHPSELLQKLNDQFTVMEKEGLTFLVSKYEPPPEHKPTSDSDNAVHTNPDLLCAAGTFRVHDSPEINIEAEDALEIKLDDFEEMEGIIDHSILSNGGNYASSQSSRFTSSQSPSHSDGPRFLLAPSSTASPNAPPASINAALVTADPINDANRGFPAMSQQRFSRSAGKGRAALKKGAVREKSGCYTCRIRRKKCDERPNQAGHCETCVRLRIQCLGFGVKRPEWLRESQNVSAMREKIKGFLAAQGMIMGNFGSGPRGSEQDLPTSDHDLPILRLDEDDDPSLSESPETPNLSHPSSDVRTQTSPAATSNIDSSNVADDSKIHTQDEVTGLIQGRERPKKSKNPHPCRLCQQANVVCQGSHPCQRCVKYGVADLCTNAAPKKGKKLRSEDELDTPNEVFKWWEWEPLENSAGASSAAVVLAPQRPPFEPSDQVFDRVHDLLYRKADRALETKFPDPRFPDRA